uniref:Transposase n=1 Tax=Candidatus Kentrum sp. TC TaxID=2126339 RepID=A0A450Z145_9GAMM|nr:MAG: hypothetical protein BECKTC1821D_GA0114238_10492 [Candidatus Kentron sp. TC]VFK60210.1 MAG: hypothetical protein BECKTC1821F_GA0114240_104221 [Candidatus Kentron sp. TC]
MVKKNKDGLFHHFANFLLEEIGQGLAFDGKGVCQKRVECQLGSRTHYYI